MKMRRQQLGFTLTELMITLVLVVIAAAVAVPSFWELLRGNEVTSRTNLLVTSLSFARNEAVQRGMPVSICASTNGSTCSGSTNWNTGWIIFTDEGTTGVVDNGDSVLRAIMEPSTNGINIGFDNAAFVQFNSAGFLQTTNLHHSWFDKSVASNDLIPNAKDSTKVSKPWLNKIVWALMPGRDAIAGETQISQPQTVNENIYESGINPEESRIPDYHSEALPNEVNKQDTTNAMDVKTPTGTTMFSVCDNTRVGEIGRAIVVYNSGMIAIVKGVCTGGTVASKEEINQNPLPTSKKAPATKADTGLETKTVIDSDGTVRTYSSDGTVVVTKQGTQTGGQE